MFVVNVPGQVDRACAHRDLDGFLRALRGNFIKVGQPDGTAGNGAVVDHATPVGEEFDLFGTNCGSCLEGMRLLCFSEAADALVHVPAEGADAPDVIVEIHLTVGDDIEPGALLIVDRHLRGVRVGLLMLHFLECDSNIAATQLLPKPSGSWIGTDHGGRKNSVNDLRGHVFLLLLASGHAVTVSVEEPVEEPGSPLREPF